MKFAPLRAGRGRWLALLLLALACIALPRLENSSVRNALFSHYQQWEPRQRLDKPAVVVGIDSHSIEEYGQWPWPRDRLAQIINRIQAQRPKAIGIDIVFSEADRYSHTALSERFPDLPDEALKRIPDPDRALAQALANAPTTLAVVGLSNHLPGSGLPMKSPAIADGARLLDNLPRYESGLISLPPLVKAAHGEGLINGPQETISTSQERGVLRRVPAIAAIDFVPLLSLPLEMARLAFESDGHVAVDISPAGIERIWIGGYSLPTTPAGEVLLHFGRPQSDYYLSAADVLDGKVAQDAFTDRFVFIGFNAVALQDRIVTPLGDNLPGVDVHVQALESLLSGEALRRPDWVRHLETGLLALWGLLLVTIVPVLKRPRDAALAMLGISALTIVGGYALFHTARLLFDGPSVIYALVPVFIALLSSTLIAADHRRRQAERELHEGREATARMTGELDAARRIQMGLLPDPGKVFKGETRFAIAAVLEPARAIGGDYYDCFLLDERRLCLAIGDVSGKGVPASLFMSMSKTLTGALTRRNVDLGQALRDVEVELSRNNPECLFVTAFVAILDLHTGDLEYACAGHDAPLLQRDGTITSINTTEISGPPLCAVGDFPFTSTHLQLQPGDTLCLFTDGASEAGGRAEDLFGRPRLEAALRATTADAPLTDRRNEVLRQIRLFEGGQPPHDDLTLMLMRFLG